MTTDPLAAAIDHIRRITPSNDAWFAKEIAFDPHDLDEVDDSIATILNAVVAGQLILANALEAERAENLRACAHLASILVERDALVAAAYEAAASASGEYMTDAGDELLCDMWREDILALSPADAQAALDKMLDNARLVGWRAGRDAAANRAAYIRGVWGAEAREFERDGLLALAAQRRARADVAGYVVDDIRALPEPKGTSHE